jgi:hypothetical protein
MESEVSQTPPSADVDAVNEALEQPTAETAVASAGAPENAPVSVPKRMFKSWEARLPQLSVNAKRDLYKALDFAARREGIAGEPLEQAVDELRYALGDEARP